MIVDTREVDRMIEEANEVAREERKVIRHNYYYISTFAALAFTAIIIPISCSAKQSSPCTPEQLAAIEAAYVTEAVETCAGQRWEECESLPEVRAKYDRIREEWVQCSN
jgi:hypothetical protein